MEWSDADPGSLNKQFPGSDGPRIGSAPPERVEDARERAYGAAQHPGNAAPPLQETMDRFHPAGFSCPGRGAAWNDATQIRDPCFERYFTCYSAPSATSCR